MIIGIGIDIVELDRIRKAIDKQPRFIDRILTIKERELFTSLSPRRKVEFLAGRSAAKESYAKALGTGIGECLSFLDIEILPDIYGRPVLSAGSEYHIHVAISHSHHAAIAQVIIES